MPSDQLSPLHDDGTWTLIKTHDRVEVQTGGGSCYAFAHADEANAQLIAAAPELLEALKRMIDVGCEHYDMDMGPNGIAAIECACAAIAKAKGGSHGS